jgi:hypothetical protein
MKKLFEVAMQKPFFRFCFFLLLQVSIYAIYLWGAIQDKSPSDFILAVHVLVTVCAILLVGKLLTLELEFSERRRIGGALL